MSRTFLGVERSVTHRRWLDRIDAKRLRSSFAIAQRYDLPEFLARVLAGRDVLPETCENFLAPSLRISLPDPLILRDMDLAVSCIARAVKEGKPLAIFGDYDVDGATSSALLLRFLRMVGGNVTRIYIPDRIREGYGPNQGAFESIAAEGARLIVCVDCGTSLSTAFDWARDEGIDVIVFDHHQAGVTLPPVLALVNPARQDDLSALGHLCAAGVVFLAIVGINRLLRESGWFQCDRQEPDLLSLLDIVALG
ncbi:MAG: DHH family phosphoesterase, partial [Alphaproteobacteria bacterium]|nr:DHH family phosphoesterase [Alphaproteobacteria bacterium]